MCHVCSRSACLLELVFWFSFSGFFRSLRTCRALWGSFFTWSPRGNHLKTLPSLVCRAVRCLSRLSLSCVLFPQRGLIHQVNLRSSYAHGMLATGLNWLLITVWSTVCTLVQPDIIRADSVHFRYTQSEMSEDAVLTVSSVSGVVAGVAEASSFTSIHASRFSDTEYDWFSARRSSRSRSPQLSPASVSRRSVSRRA